MPAVHLCKKKGHFLLTKSGRDVRPEVLWEMSEDAAYATFCALRWSANDS